MRPGKARARAAIAACSVAIAAAGAAAAAGPERVVDYLIDVRLDPTDHTLDGRQTLTWINTTESPATDLRFHLYLNAFKNDRTTFMKESGGRHRGHRMRDGEWGWIDVTSMTGSGGEDLLSRAEFVQPDDGNVEDETVLRVPLSDPIPPRGSITLDMTFAARLPRVFARTGHKGDFHFVGQWYPKIGVLEESGWNCHQFHSNSEFFADFGRFDVSITVPEGWVLGATGALQGDPRINGDGTVTHRYVQEDVHDFAWTVDPDYVRSVRLFRYEEQRDAQEEARVARAMGIAADSEELRLRDVEVTLLLHPEHAGQADRHFAAAFNALRYFGTWYGSYPYGTLTVVDPPYGGRGAGGMEYPTLITAGTAWIAPARRQSPESVTIHEFGHQYWYGMVASNEFEEAFLDEGFNTYSTGLVLEKAYGPNLETTDLITGLPFAGVPLVPIPIRPGRGEGAGAGRGAAAAMTDLLLLRPFGPSDDLALNAFRDLPFLNHARGVFIDQVTQQRRRYLTAPKADALARRSWEYLNRESYGLNSYARTALVLRTLQGILGDDHMLRVMRTWFQRHRFTHPTVEDFIATVVDVAGPVVDGVPIESFFRQAIFGSDVMDYAVDRVSCRRQRPGRGVFGPPDAREIRGTGEEPDHDESEGSGDGDEDGPEPGAAWENEVVVRRLGEFIWPQTIEIRLEGGASDRRAWDGAYRWVRYEQTGPRVAATVVDPEGGLALDVNRSNNARTRAPDRMAALAWWSRILQWMQHVAYFYSGIS